MSLNSIIRFIPNLSNLESSSTRYDRILSVGNWVMLISLICVIISILIGYVYPDYFSLVIQVLSHLVLIVAVTGIKLGYLMRCVGRHGLGEKEL